MPVLHSEVGVVAAVGSPVKKSKLSLKFFQKKDTKRALDFSEYGMLLLGYQILHDQVVPVPCPSSPLTSEKCESLVPFVGLNNLGNTCYLNSILQVYCSIPFSERKKVILKAAANLGDTGEITLPVPMELLGSFHSLISSVEQLQSSFLLNPEKYSDGELATPPRKLLNTLRQLNPMYEGYLQHDAQEVLQCILANIQEACDNIKKEQTDNQKDNTISNGMGDSTHEDDGSSDGQLSGKRKSDTEAGNAKKKPKSQSKSKKNEENVHMTRSKRKSSSDITTESSDQRNGTEEQEKERGKLGWLKPSGKQPSIFSKFRSMGRITSHVGGKGETKEKSECSVQEKQEKDTSENESRTQELPQSLHALHVLPNPQKKVQAQDFFIFIYALTPAMCIKLMGKSSSLFRMDPYAGLSKVNTPLQTPLKLSLHEWCTQPDSPDQSHHYELFAVVMHSGVTISSGHYTTYIRMMDLHRTTLRLQSQDEEQARDQEEDMKPKKEEGPQTEYDDGEVSFSLSGRGRNVARASATSMSSKSGSKRCSEGVGLLGGQRSVTSYELSNSTQSNPEKASSLASRAAGSLLQNAVKKETEEEGVDSMGDGTQVNFDLALRNLLDFEGKWMLFDDSEVRLFEEEDFLRSCSPETCSTSTPYLLFYKRVSQ
uniref:Ubiquitin carboxyl-terminal hydrolase n=1 Tax=Cyprinus carpio TaxID=7962 RepID=A0A8C2IV89_CYPCA